MFWCGLVNGSVWYIVLKWLIVMYVFCLDDMYCLYVLVGGIGEKL